MKKTKIIEAQTIKTSKRDAEKIDKHSAVTTTRDSKKAKIVDVQEVDVSDMLKIFKRRKSAIADKPKSENIVETNENKSTECTDHAATKMAAKRKVNDTRVQAKKKLKIQSDKPIATLNDKENSGEGGNSLSKTPKPVIKRRRRIRSKVMRTSIENVGDLKLTKKHVQASIQSIRTLMQKQQESKKTLLPMDSEPLFMQIECIKIPKTPRMTIRPYLPHPLAGPLDDVALFVQDLAKGRRRDYEPTVDHWETLLKEKGVDCIKEIIPLNRVKTEYRQHEMQRKLAMSYDYFLADGRICGQLTHLLGTAFSKRRDPPTPLKLEHDNLKEEFNFALHKTCIAIHPYGNSHTMQVGTMSMEAKKLEENVWAACEELAKLYPGGWRNIRCIRIKTKTGPAIPIYMNLVSKNNVAVPVVKPKRPRAYETVKGELTTVPGGAIVKLTPEGKVRVRRLKDYADPEEKNDDEAEEEEEIDEESDGENVESKEVEDDE